jgi:hypothetical protein
MEHNEQVILQERVWAWPIDDARSTCDEWRKRCVGNRERFGFRYDNRVPWLQGAEALKAEGARE